MIQRGRPLLAIALTVLFVASAAAVMAASSPAAPGPARPLGTAAVAKASPGPASTIRASFVNPSPAPLPSSRPSPASAASPAAPGPAASSPVVTTGWNALHFGLNSGISNGWVPPDVQVAAGPTYVVEMVNLLMGVYTKSGTQVQVTALSSFFNTGSDFISDPKIQFDPASGRWFASLTDVATNAGVATGQVLLAVSTTSDPTGTWRLYSVPSAPTGECLDQPILGVGTTTVILSVNVFSTCLSNTFVYVGAQYWVVNKTDLTAGVASPAIYAAAPDVNEGSIHPVQVQGASDVHYMVSTYWPGTATTSNTLHLFTVAGTPSATTPTVSVTIASLSMPTAAVPPPAPQLGSRNSLDTGDIRISDAVWQNGKLWLGFDEACLADANRACVRLVEIDTTAKTVLQDFDVNVAGKDVYYPAFRMDAQGNLAIVLAYSSSTSYPGILVTGRVYGDAPNTYQTPAVVLAGTGAENPSGCKTTCRYGDYFGAGLDPSDTSTVWLAGQMGTPSGWGTHIFAARVKAEIITAEFVQGGGTGYAAPQLTYVLNGATSTATLNPVASVLADPGSAWSVTKTLAGSTLLERWQTGVPLTLGVVDASFNATFVYYHQYTAIFNATVSGTPPMAPQVAVTQFGLQSWFATSALMWADAASQYTYRNPLVGSTSSQRWYTHDPFTGTVTGPLAVAVRYFEQFNVSFALVVTGAIPYSGPAPKVSVTAYGITLDVNVPGTAWVDAGAAYAYPVTLVGSNDTIRWAAPTGANGTVTSANPITAIYRAQYAVRLIANPAGAAGLLTGGGWYDPGMTATVAGSSNASWEFQGWTGAYAGMGSSLRLAVNGPITVSASYFPGLTIVAGSGGSVSYAYGSTTGIVPAGSSRTIYVAPGTQVQLTASPSSVTDAFGGWTGAASGPSGSVSVTVNAPGTAAASFGLSLLVVLVLPAVVVLAVVLLALFVVLRRRKRQPPAAP